MKTIMERSICLFFLMLFFSFPAWADKNEKFTSMATEFIRENRCIISCEQPQGENRVMLKTTDGRTLSIRCVWYPYSKKGVLYLQKLRGTDYVLLGYGQSPDNPTFCYLLPASKVRKKLAIDQLEQYRLKRPLSDCTF